MMPAAATPGRSHRGQAGKPGPEQSTCFLSCGRPPPSVEAAVEAPPPRRRCMRGGFFPDASQEALRLPCDRSRQPSGLASSPGHQVPWFGRRGRPAAIQCLRALGRQPHGGAWSRFPETRPLRRPIPGESSRPVCARSVTPPAGGSLHPFEWHRRLLHDRGGDAGWAAFPSWTPREEPFRRSSGAKQERLAHSATQSAVASFRSDPSPRGRPRDVSAGAPPAPFPTRRRSEAGGPRRARHAQTGPRSLADSSGLRTVSQRARSHRALGEAAADNRRRRRDGAHLARARRQHRTYAAAGWC
eukprot:scaffold11_cov257-Pinguiococcus_pyrenoidosus.AAC.64